MSKRVYADDQVSLQRDEHGVIHVRADDEAGLYRGLGYAHGRDRGMQMLFMRILGQGRAAELFDASLLDTDLFFRKMNWHGGLPEETAKLGGPARLLAAAYVNGVNLAFARSTPWEMRMLRYRPEPWSIEDTILLSRMNGYLTLAQSQGELERWIVEAIQAGVSDAHLEDLFPGQLGGLDRALLTKVRLGERVVPESVRSLAGGARLMASNNWVVSGSRTPSGLPILANDPHLEINRLPALWYEIVVETPGRYAVSATAPGLCGLLLTRTNDLAWGATYSFADATDSWIEEVKGDRVRRQEGWVPLRKRVEHIVTKGGGAEEIVFWETDEHGVLDGAPVGEGLQLATRWAGSCSGAESIEAMFAMWNANTVEEGMRHIGALETSFNWVLADSAGHIGYQMSGLLPVRRSGWSGLVPVPGWDPQNDWRGFHSPADLPRSFDPADGFIVTANQDLNHLGKVAPINAPMGHYRAQRITELLAAKEVLDTADMKRIQLDLRSTQAELFLDVLRPLLPDTPDGRAIQQWNLEYDADSVGAEAFERFYGELFKTVFGRVLGSETVGFLSDETGLFTDFYASFDRVLLSERSPWFGTETRQRLFEQAAMRALTGAPRPWGANRKVVQEHLMLGGKLPRALGFDRGPLTLAGGRATPHQGQIYRSGGRLTTFAPSYRMVTDFAANGFESCLAGGVSDRRFSRWYYSDMKNWRVGRHKRLGPLFDGAV